jgi:hypothetical protein
MEEVQYINEASAEEQCFPSCLLMDIILSILHSFYIRCYENICMLSGDHAQISTGLVHEPGTLNATHCHRKCADSPHRLSDHMSTVGRAVASPPTH